MSSVAPTGNMSSDQYEIGGDEVGESATPYSKRTKTSLAWELFEKFVDNDGLPKAKCKNCGQIYIARNTSGTSNMKNHTLKCRGLDVSSHPHLDQAKFREKISGAIIKHNYPFSFVEQEGIQDLLCFLHPQAITTSRNTARADVVKLYKKERENLKLLLSSIPGKICLTSDLWSSITTDQYMVLTAHYITKNWEIQKKVLAFFHLPPPHTSLILAEKLLSLLKDWGIDKKVFTITLDNASYNDAMVNILKKHPIFGSGLVHKGEHFHIRCGAHILNLIVHEGLKVITGSLVKIRESVKYIRGSDARKTKFASCLAQLPCITSRQLRQDVPTRWNSCYLMLESAIGFREAFSLLKNVDPYFDDGLSEGEWVEVEKLAAFLKPFYDITTLFSGTSYPTANLYFHGVWRIQYKIEEVACYFHEDFENENQVCCMAKRMKGKFDKYWHDYSVVLSFAVILDPRYKLQFVEYCYVKLYGTVEGVKLAKEVYDKMVVFFQECLKSSSDDTTISYSQPSVRGSPSIPPSNEVTGFDTYQSQLCESTSKQSDLQVYLLEKRLDHKLFADLDVLEYWKSNEGKYPELSVMARDVLSIPITTVASESAFSIGGRILNKYRSSLLPENVEALLCTNDWLCGTPAMSDLDLDSKELVEDFSTFIS